MMTKFIERGTSLFYLADGANEKIRIFDRLSLTELTSFGDGGRQPGQFYAVHDSIATDSKGNIYTTETYRGQRLQKFVEQGPRSRVETESGNGVAGAGHRAEVDSVQSFSTCKGRPWRDATSRPFSFCSCDSTSNPFAILPALYTEILPPTQSECSRHR